MLQKAVDDSALEVVVEAADGLESFGALNATPVLAGLLHHHSQAVRETAAQALERSADAAVLKEVTAGLDDTSPTVRFSLVGALAHIGRDGGGLSEEQQKQVLDKVEVVLQHDADPGVRSRAATALGECGGPAQLAPLWRSVTASEDARVQEKAWQALVEIVARSNSLPLVQEWDRTMASAKQDVRRVQLLAKSCAVAETAGDESVGGADGGAAGAGPARSWQVVGRVPAGARIYCRGRGPTRKPASGCAGC